MTNRQAILLAGIAAMLPHAALAAGKDVPREAALPVFEPPSEAVITRTLSRHLHDGNVIEVTRRYAVQFVKTRDGYRLDGTLLDVQVDAPADLAPLADIERNRPDRAFPIMIDRNGTIVEGSEPSQLPRARMADVAGKLVQSAPIPTAMKAEARTQAAALAATAATNPVPGELFRPQSGSRREVRSLALPGGQQGEVQIDITVGPSRVASLPGRVERTITTRMLNTSRVSKEVWQIAAR